MKTRNIVLLILFSLFVCCPLNNALYAKKKASSHRRANYSINFPNIYMQHNEYRNNVKGMYINFAADIDGLQDVPLRWTISLYKKNGSPIYFKNGGKAVVDRYITPSYPSTHYEEEWGWFPYNSLRFGYGRTYCYALIRIYDDQTGKLLKTSKKIDFWYDS